VPDLALSLATLLPHSGAPYIALVLIGFAVAIVGYASSSRRLVIVGIVLISLGAFLFPVALNLGEPTPPQLKNR
jgi:hypothetical protein